MSSALPMAELGLAHREQATLQVLTQEVITTSEIEGERLSLDAVRSSIAHKLGMDIGALSPSDRHVDDVVDVVLDATRNFDQALSAVRLFGWHATLSPPATAAGCASPWQHGARMPVAPWKWCQIGFTARAQRLTTNWRPTKRDHWM